MMKPLKLCELFSNLSRYGRQNVTTIQSRLLYMSYNYIFNIKCLRNENKN